ncbi:hypothetical protein [Sphingobium sp.]|uniref:hypothetical protein n=1 Tax=Sphingobium sp. TaxID=1912891 RepID=UPI002CEE5CD3|nr:hypothetical protein [Sphingobium sp.]HUD94253.1 hypothetical protein [Sphingobium sp.]
MQDSIATIEQRLDRLEHMMGDSIRRLDQLQHLVELVLSETHARRRDAAAATEGKTRWSDEGFPILPRNWPVHFGTDHDDGDHAADDFLAGGWFGREGWGVWGSDEVHSLRFALEEYSGGYVTVHLGLRFFILPGMDRPGVDILANGYFLGNHKLSALGRVVTLRLPPSCIGDGNILLQLKHEAAISPASTGAVPDGRVLGVGLSTLDAA